jgi:simple sugar transport system ATP-binding protein
LTRRLSWDALSATNERNIDRVGQAGMTGDRDIASTIRPRLELRGITKRFPGCLANDHIDLAIAPGELHALLGENGAGKSTLVKIIYGVVHADEGVVLWESETVHIHSPAFARRLGIGMVFQQFTLFETLTVAENIALGMAASGEMKAFAQRIAAMAERYGLSLDPNRHVYDLSVGERQRAEIVRCLMQSPRLLIMDEPTSVLTPQEVERLFVTLRRLAAEGCSVLYISHKLDEVRALCERATVLRGGRVSAECDPREESTASLARMMVGTEVVACARPVEHAAGAEVLAIAELTMPPEDPHGIGLEDVRLGVRAGEIVGIAGVAGNGQTELLRVLAGERLAPAPQHIRLEGAPVGRLGPAERRRRGMAFVPEDRLGRGAVAELTMAENTLLTAYLGGLVRHGLVRERPTRALAARIMSTFNVMAAGVDAEARSLSGGNLQKFILGREILQEPKLLIAAHPSWGVDVGAALTIHKALIALRDRGAAVLIVSEDLDELFEICDRIAVISKGRLSTPRRVAETTIDAVGLLMGGRIDADDREGRHEAA